MSTVETTETATAKTVELKRTYEGFSDTLDLVSKEETGSYTEFTDSSKAIEYLNQTGSFVDAANSVLRRNTLKDMRANAGISGTINREVLMSYIKPYRELPQFAAMIKSEDKRKATGEEWNAQTKAICDQIKNVPFIMDAIRKASEAANASSSDNE